MTPLDMIAEWRKGCSCAGKEHPEECHECTLELINSIERYLKVGLNVNYDFIDCSIGIDGKPLTSTR
jgi:hypothetical protein